MSDRPCTCHPDDNPPRPCQQKYALSECKAAPAPEPPLYAAPPAVQAEPVAFVITDEKINFLQVNSIKRFIERAKHAHFTNIYYRINGKDEVVEADWLKHLQLASTPAVQGDPYFLGLAHTLLKALKRLSFAAQTACGTAGLDTELVDAIAEAERAIEKSKGYPAAPPADEAVRLLQWARASANTSKELRAAIDAYLAKVTR